MKKDLYVTREFLFDNPASISTISCRTYQFLYPDNMTYEDRKPPTHATFRLTHGPEMMTLHNDSEKEIEPFIRKLQKLIGLLRETSDHIVRKECFARREWLDEQKNFTSSFCTVIDENGGFIEISACTKAVRIYFDDLPDQNGNMRRDLTVEALRRIRRMLEDFVLWLQQNKQE